MPTSELEHRTERPCGCVYYRATLYSGCAEEHRLRSVLMQARIDDSNAGMSTKRRTQTAARLEKARAAHRAHLTADQS